MAGNLISIIFHTFFAKLKISWEYQIQHLNSSFNIFNMMQLFIFAKDRWLNQKKCWSFWKSQTCFQELFLSSCWLLISNANEFIWQQLSYNYSFLERDQDMKRRCQKNLWRYLVDDEERFTSSQIFFESLNREKC